MKPLDTVNNPKEGGRAKCGASSPDSSRKMTWFEEKGKCEKGCLVWRFVVMDKRGQERESRILKIMSRLKRGPIYVKRRMNGIRELTY